VIALALAASALVAPAFADPLDPTDVRVLDGDTIEAHGAVYRLVGFDAPETGYRAQCSSERDRGVFAKARLVALVAGGYLDLERVACSCWPGTEGTRSCNHGGRCGTLRAGGRDVGDILISEGLARPYVCGPRSCPARQGWCG
jgi:endonuclease YncB( thermonuclease family)